MLYYNVDFEIMENLYNDFLAAKQEGLNAVRELGRRYIPIAEKYHVDEKPAKVINDLARVPNENNLEVIENLLIHYHLLRKTGVKKEIEEYGNFCQKFDGTTRRALAKLPDYLEGRSFSYRIKNRGLHLEIIDSSAMGLSLEFEDVLIEDGRNPREIAFDRMTIEEVEQERVITYEDGTEKKTKEPLYRFSFVNKLGQGEYPSKVSSFLFRDVKGSLQLYNYGLYTFNHIEGEDKLPWRRMYSVMEDIIGKIGCLGIPALNEEEINALSLLCVFYELIGFYLKEETRAAHGISACRFNPLDADFAFSEDDIKNTCDFLAPYDFDLLIKEMGRAFSDKEGFCRYWIYYASSAQGAELFSFLEKVITACGRGYQARPLPLGYRKHQTDLRHLTDRIMFVNGFEGAYPNYFKELQPQFVEVSSVYSKMYTYVNEKRKVIYFEFVENTGSSLFTVDMIKSEILLRDRDDADLFTAMDGWFSDGGRRRAKLCGSFTPEPSWESEEMEEEAREFIEGCIRE